MPGAPPGCIFDTETNKLYYNLPQVCNKDATLHRVYRNLRANLQANEP